MGPLVSIVINNYNYARFIGQAIESALSQTYAHSEIIIVDDGSTDESRSIIDKYRGRVIILLKENGGQASAFNVGIMRAKGKFILLLDSDDYLFPDAVASCVASFPEGYSRVYYRLSIVDEDGKKIPGYEQNAHFRDFDGDMLSDVKKGAPFFWPPTSGNFLDAEKLKATLPIPEIEYRICADSFIFVWTSLQGPVRSIDQELAAYRIHGKNHHVHRTFEYSDPKKLKAYIDDHYRVQRLLDTACRKAGFEYNRQPDYKTYRVLKMLCVGFRMKIDSPNVRPWGMASLLRRVGQYLRAGEASVTKRIVQSVYMTLILISPVWISMSMVRQVDAWRNHESR